MERILTRIPDADELFAVICDNYIIEKDGPGACLHKTEKRIF